MMILGSPQQLLAISIKPLNCSWWAAVYRRQTEDDSIAFNHVLLGVSVVTEWFYVYNTQQSCHIIIQ